MGNSLVKVTGSENDSERPSGSCHECGFTGSSFDGRCPYCGNSLEDGKMSSLKGDTNKPDMSLDDAHNKRCGFCSAEVNEGYTHCMRCLKPLFESSDNEPSIDDNQEVDEGNDAVTGDKEAVDPSPEDLDTISEGCSVCGHSGDIIMYTLTENNAPSSLVMACSNCGYMPVNEHETDGTNATADDLNFVRTIVSLLSVNDDPPVSEAASFIAWDMLEPAKPDRPVTFLNEQQKEAWAALLSTSSFSSISAFKTVMESWKLANEGTEVLEELQESEAVTSDSEESA